MALANYTDLQTTLATWVERAGDSTYTTNVVDIIALAEAKLNRQLGVVETDAALTGTVNSRTVDISALSMTRPVALFASYFQNHETQLTPKNDGTYEEQNNAGRPRYWSIDGTTIVFDRILDSAYAFRFRYDQKFNLATSSTNWLLTNYPDVYLAACIAWSGAFYEDFTSAGNWKAVLDEGIDEVRHVIAQTRKGDLVVDRALQLIGRRWRDNSWINEVS
jgi:hypothetical protein